MAFPNGYTFVGHSGGGYQASQSRLYAPFINKYASAYKLDPRLIACVIQAESSWNPNLPGSDGSWGLGQFTTSTGPSYGQSTKAQKINPELSIKAIAWYYSSCLASAKGDARLAYKMYNGGQGIMSRGSAARTQAESNTKQNWDPAYKSWFNNSCIAPSKTTPAVNNNNTDAAKDAAKKAQTAADAAKKAAADKATAAKKAADLKAQQALDKAKATKDAAKIKAAQAAVDAQKKSNVTPAKTTTPAKKTDNASTPNKVVKSSFGIIAIVGLLFLRNAYMNKETL